MSAPDLELAAELKGTHRGRTPGRAKEMGDRGPGARHLVTPRAAPFLPDTRDTSTPCGRDHPAAGSESGSRSGRTDALRAGRRNGRSAAAATCLRLAAAVARTERTARRPPPAAGPQGFTPATKGPPPSTCSRCPRRASGRGASPSAWLCPAARKRMSIASRSGGAAMMSGPSRSVRPRPSSRTGPRRWTACHSAPRRTSQGLPRMGRRRAPRASARACGDGSATVAVLEREQEVLADRLDALEAVASIQLGDPEKRRARMRRVGPHRVSPPARGGAPRSRWIASPSGTAASRGGQARRGPGRNPASSEQRHDLRSLTRLAVEALDREALLRPLLRTCATSAVEGGSEPALVRITQRDERAAAALDEERGLAAEQDDVRTGDPGRRAPAALRPRQRRSVGLRGIGGGEHERVRLVALARTQFAQPLDRAAERELRAPEALDEVAAAAEAERLERLQLAVDGARSRPGCPRRGRRRA